MKRADRQQRDSTPNLRGSAVTVLFLLLFAGSVLPERRPHVAPLSSQMRGAATEARVYEERRVAEHAARHASEPVVRPVAPVILRFRRVESRGLPAPRAPTNSGQGSIA